MLNHLQPTLNWGGGLPMCVGMAESKGTRVPACTLVRVKFVVEECFPQETSNTEDLKTVYTVVKEFNPQTKLCVTCMTERIAYAEALCVALGTCANEKCLKNALNRLFSRDHPT